jgi:hypothetical protein
MPQSPPDLSRLQRSLKEILTDPQGVRAAVSARPAALRWIAETPPPDAPTRLSVYGDGYFLRLLEALTSDFPAVRRTLGEDDFRILVANYLKTNQSRSPTLADLGEAFPCFVSSHPLSRRYPFLADLSRLERDIMTRLFEGRLPALDPETIGKIRAEDWARVRLIFDPTVLLLKVAWPVERLWQRRELPLKAGGRIIRRARAQWLLIFRDETWVKVVEISRPEWDTLRQVKEGAQLGRVFTRASKSLGGTKAAEIQGWLSSWIRSGLIKRIERPQISAKTSRMQRRITYAANDLRS